jgi:hypothetical protein
MRTATKVLLPIGAVAGAVAVAVRETYRRRLRARADVGLDRR